MARIAGVNLPTNKRVVIALTYIHGIGNTKAREITEKLSIAPERRVQDLNDQEVLHIREAIDAGYKVEGDLRRVPWMTAPSIANGRVSKWVAVLGSAAVSASRMRLDDTGSPSSTTGATTSALMPWAAPSSRNTSALPPRL